MKILIVGGGAAGMMAAITSKRLQPKNEVHIVEKNPTLGKKILICGAGRCNLTNSKLSKDRFYGANRKFIGSVINQFNAEKIRGFFEDLGIELYEEVKNGRRKGKIFPNTNSAHTVNDLLINEIERLGVEIHTETEVQEIKKLNDIFVVVTDKEELSGDKVILALGGKTYPNMGATGFGYEIAEKFGHTVIKPVPSALPLEADHWVIKRLTGIKLMAEVTSIINNEDVRTDTDEVMFTNYGLSGPAILNVSRDISIRLNRDEVDDCIVKINMMPGRGTDSYFSYMDKIWKKRGDQKVLYSLYGHLHPKIPKAVLEYLHISADRLNYDLSTEDKHRIVNFITNWQIEIHKTRGWEQGEFTAGGVDAKEIEELTLESKIIPGLHFAGEVVNIDGDVGGFNLSWAWASGFVAGSGASKSS